ncbi:hypothetical protein [Streptomyces olivaceoviridis]|uniref:hypothetical protein n=1 Tax=Streptomyces olivaceoviridis TaxID=1921 RepID=UPI0036BED429
MAISAEDQIIHYLKDKVGLAEADALVAAWKRETADSVLQFAEQEDGHLATASASVYVKGIRDAAKHIIEQ